MVWLSRETGASRANVDGDLALRLGHPILVDCEWIEDVLASQASHQIILRGCQELVSWDDVHLVASLLDLRGEKIAQLAPVKQVFLCMHPAMCLCIWGPAVNSFPSGKVTVRRSGRGGRLPREAKLRGIVAGEGK